MSLNNLNKLNKQQMDAVLNDSRVMLIVAGAGTGKTSTVVAKICHSIENCGLYPDQIIATTFTNKAAYELKDRLRMRIGHSADQIRVGTFHRLSLDVLREHGDRIGIRRDFITLPAEDQSQVMKTILSKNKLKDLSPGKVLDKIHKYKEGDISVLNSTEEQIFNAYTAYLEYSNMLDFTDLITGAIKVWQNNPDILKTYHEQIKLICVDEFQDINNLQYNWMKLVRGPECQLCCVGDSDQAIYGFRNANARYILDFSHYFPSHYMAKLECNYRSKAQILQTANSLIKFNKKRIDKTLYPNASDSDKAVEITYSPSCRVEASNVAKKILELQDRGSVAILVRNRAQIQTLEEAMVIHNIPYNIVGSIAFINRSEIKDMLAYLKFLHNPKDAIAFKRMIQSPKRGIGETTIEKIIDFANREQCDLLQASREVVKNLSQSYQIKINELTSILRDARTFKDLFSIANHIFTRSGYQQHITEDREANINQWMLSLSEFSSLEEYLEKILWQSEEKENGGNVVQIMTIHASKGLEFDYVFLPAWEEGILPYSFDKTSDEIEEERRLAYVGLTRARSKAFVSYTGLRYSNGITSDARPSRFIRELGISESVSQNSGPRLTPGLKVIHPRFGIGYVIESGSSSARVKFFDMTRIVETNILQKK